MNLFSHWKAGGFWDFFFEICQAFRDLVVCIEKASKSFVELVDPLPVFARIELHLFLDLEENTVDLFADLFEAFALFFDDRRKSSFPPLRALYIRQRQIAIA